MTRARAACSVIVVVSGAWLAAAAQDGATFRVRTDLVTVGVSVRENGRPLPGLQAKDFEIRDNGVRQDVVSLTYETFPIDVTVALDVSESVTGALLEQMRRAIGQLGADLQANDRLKLLTFNMRVRRLVHFTERRDGADAALARARAVGSTSLIDTLAVALVAPPQPDRRQLVLLFSDGLDTSSVTDRPTIVELAKHSAATASFVLPASGMTVGSSRALYDQLAAETGGVVVGMQPRDDLGPTFRRVLTEFRSSYVLHFAPKGVQPGGVHALEVQVDRRSADVRARRGYAWKQ